MSRLVLTRKTDESVVIQKNDEIIASIKVSRIDRNQVRLAFDAERDIKIDREEVFKNQMNKK
jgi:carbon storage regulator CsrA